MNNCLIGLTATISAAAAAIAKDMTSEEIAYLGAVLVQLGDTLTTICTHRSLCENKNKDTENNSEDNQNPINQSRG